MSEIAKKLKNFGRRTLPVAVASLSLIEPTSIRADDPKIISPVPQQGSHTLRIEGDIPSTRHFNENFIVKESGAPRETASASEYLTSYDFSQMEPSEKSIKAYTWTGGMYTGEIKNSGELQFRRLESPDFSINSIETSKKDDDLIIATGLGFGSTRPGLILSKDGGKNWKEHVVGSSKINGAKLTPDDKYAFLYPANDYYPPGVEKMSRVYRLDIKTGAITSYSFPDIKDTATFTSPSDLYYDPATDSYTQFVGSRTYRGFETVDALTGFYKVTYYPDGQAHKIKYVFPFQDIVPRKLTTFVNKNNLFTIWMTEDYGKIIEIQDDKVTRVIYSGGTKTSVLNLASIYDVEIDAKNDIGYLITQHTKSLDFGNNTSNRTVHIETIPLTEVSNPDVYRGAVRYATVLPEDESWPKGNSNYRNVGITSVEKDGRKYLVSNPAPLDRSNQSVYYKDVTNQKYDKKWQRAKVGHRLHLPVGK